MNMWIFLNGTEIELFECINIKKEKLVTVNLF